MTHTIRASILFSLLFASACVHNSAAAPSGEAPVAFRVLPDDQRAVLLDRYTDAVEASSAWKSGKNVLDPRSTELAMILGTLPGNSKQRAVAQKAVVKSFALIDPIWGGVSAAPDQTKSLGAQAESLRLYALAWRTWRGASFRRAALSVDAYLQRFLAAPEGGYYAGQLAPGDAAASRFFYSLDEQARASIGAPAIDQRILAGDNGRVIRALVALYRAGGDADALSRAVSTASKILDGHRREDGGFASESSNVEGNLDDTVVMARALAELAEVSGDASWAREAESAGAYVAAKLEAMIASGLDGTQENADRLIEIARLAQQLHRIAGSEEHRVLARRALHQAALCGAEDPDTIAGLLLAEADLERKMPAAIESLPRPLFASTR